MAPYFSVIMPVYNVENYLRRCVSSVLEQNFSDIEIILVDDGSTDNSGSLCDSLSRENPCIRVIHKENGGLSSARNAGIQAAKGKYIWFVDSDDWVKSGSLKKLYEVTCKDAPDMVKFNCVRVTETHEITCSNALPGTYDGEQIRHVLLQQAFYSAGKYILSAWAHIYRREFICRNSLKFISERLVGSEDYLFNLEAIVKAERISVLADTFYYYELRQGSLTQQYKNDLLTRYEQLYEQLSHRLPQEYEGEIAAFFLWHLLRGTCIPNEYYAAKAYAMDIRRAKVRNMLGTDTVKKAYRCCKKNGFSRKQRLLLWAMYKKAEPLFYWLYVVKTKQ